MNDTVTRIEQARLDDVQTILGEPDWPLFPYLPMRRFDGAPGVLIHTHAHYRLLRMSIDEMTTKTTREWLALLRDGEYYATASGVTLAGWRVD